MPEFPKQFYFLELPRKTLRLYPCYILHRRQEVSKISSLVSMEGLPATFSSPCFHHYSHSLQEQFQVVWNHLKDPYTNSSENYHRETNSRFCCLDTENQGYVAHLTTLTIFSETSFLYTFYLPYF